MITQEGGKHSELLLLSFSLNQVQGFQFHEFHYFYGLCCIFLLGCSISLIIKRCKIKKQPTVRPLALVLIRVARTVQMEAEREVSLKVELW